jgi:NAD(P)-dependent dehydrogenase (short-subunit alcohol dehydrogenase family)
MNTQAQQTKIALVTGGSRGLGKDMVIRLAQKGSDIIFTYKTSEEEAKNVVAAIEALGQKAAALKLDTGNVSSFPAFVTELSNVLKSHFNADKFDYLVNNAGFNYVIPSFEATTEEMFDDLMNVHYKGVFFLTQKLLRLINNGGSIVNLSTGLTRFVHAGSGTYASMKAAVQTLTRYLAQELGSRGIRANVVAPGAIATDFSGGRLKASPQIQEHIKSVTALARVGQPDDIGGVVAFLCSDDAQWVTAQVIEASGGMYL